MTRIVQITMTRTVQILCILKGKMYIDKYLGTKNVPVNYY
jgi:hypothetical protein